MWSDPDIAKIDSVRDATNRDLARHSRIGGWAYVLCCLGVVSLSPLLWSQRLCAAVFVVVFVVIAFWRGRVCSRALEHGGAALDRFERLAAWLYMPVAVVWVLFMAWVFASIRQFDAVVAIALIVSQGVFVGGVGANFQRIRLMLSYSIVICVMTCVVLLVLIPGYLSAMLLLLSVPYGAFVVFNSKHMHQSYWSNWEQRLRLEQQASDLERAREQAYAANRAKSRFLANMSHEIRTPMSGVLGMAELLTHSLLDVDQQKQVGAIRSSGQSLLRVMDDILDFAKLETSKLTLAVRSFDPLRLAQEVAMLFQTRIASGAVEFRAQLPATLPMLIGDADRIRQIMSNLLSNAFKFTRRGSVTFQVACSAPDDEGKVEFTFAVIDTGVGISQQDQQRLFQEFVQVGVPTLHIQGTGLGLVISRSLVSLMDGEIALTSELDQGSAFRVTLPLKVDALGSATTDAPSLPVATGDTGSVRRIIRVLLVEDNEVNQAVSEAMLIRLGCVVTIAENGQLAIDQFVQERPDIILMDCNMPVMDGFEATRHIRSLEQGPSQARVPIVALTAHVLEEVKEQCLQAGMDAHVGKPSSMAQMRQVLRQYVKS